MPRRLTNLVLLIAVPTLVVTGLVAWVLPESKATPLYDLHRIVGIALVLALPWKEAVASASLRRRLRRPALTPGVVPGVLTAVALAVAIVLGLAWTGGLVSFDRPWAYSLLNVHVYAGLALVPLLVWHAARRWERGQLRLARPARREVVRLLGLGALAAVLGPASRLIPDGRRPSGSKHAGSFSGNDFPLTIWLFDEVPSLDAGRWRLRLDGRLDEPGALAYADLLAGPRREIDAVIDCTGGWWSEQRWTGAPLHELLRSRGAPDDALVTAVAVTGHRWSFRLEDLADALVATHVGGEVLTAGHGFPARLVVPGRRGFQWVKWLDRIEVS